MRVNRLRAERFAEARQMGFRMAIYVHPSASLWGGYVLAENWRINDNASIQPFARLGDNVFVGSVSGCVISHHSVIEDHCHLSSGIHVAGQVNIGPYCYLGIHATVRNRVSIAPRCVIRAGTVILGDTVERSVYMARPAELLAVHSGQLSPA